MDKKQVALITCYNAAGELLLGKRRDVGLWTLPGGGLDPGELPADGARRELLEETGLQARTLSVLTTIDLPGAFLHCFSAWVEGTPHSHNDPDNEVSEWRFVNISEGLPKEYADNLYGPKDVDLNIVLRLFNIRAEGDRSLQKSELLPEDEITRLLRHPNPAERSMAMKLNGVQQHHLDVAAKDPEPSVHQAAIDHPSWSNSNSHMLLIAPGFLPAKKYLLHSAKASAQDLTDAYGSATPADRSEVLNIMVGHKGLAPEHAVLLLNDPELPAQDRTKVLALPITPREMHEDILDNFLQTQGFPVEFARQSVLSPAVPHEKVMKIVQSAIGSTRADMIEVAQTALRNLAFTSQEIYQVISAAQAIGWPSQAVLMVAAASGPGALPEHVDHLVRLRNPTVDQILHNCPIVKSEHIDEIVRLGDMAAVKTFFGHPSWTSKNLRTLLAREALQKSSNNLIDTDICRHPVVDDMLGFDPHLNDAFKAARFLSGLKDIPMEAVRAALYSADGDPVAAALMAYGMEVTPQARKAIAGVAPLASIQKAEPVSVEAQSVTAPRPEGEDTAQSVSRAFADGYVYSVGLNGRHSKGAMVARDSRANKVWLLKPGSGGGSPAAGANQDPSTQSEREAAWFQVALAVGLDKWFPKTELLHIDGKEFAAIALLPFDYRNFDKIRRNDSGEIRRILQPLVSDGTLHKLAALDFVLGNSDRHAQNCMANPAGQMKLIDHGSAFAGSAFAPGLDQNSFVPFYLRAWAPDTSFNNMSLDEKLRYMPRIGHAAAHEIRVWVMGIKQTQILPILMAYGIDPAPVLARLAILRERISVLPADTVINQLWVAPAI